MSAALRDSTLVKYDDKICILYRRDSMRHEQAGSASHNLSQMSENLLFGVGVHRRKRIIQNQNSGSADQCSGNRRSLLLLTRKSDAAFSENRFVSVGKRFDVFGQSRFGRRRAYFTVGCLLDTKRNVLGNCVAEQKRFLRDVANRRPERCQRDLPYGSSVD